jgi:hypothetical protein
MAHGQPFGKDALLESPGTAQHNWTAVHQSIQRIRFTQAAEDAREEPPLVSYIDYRLIPAVA